MIRDLADIDPRGSGWWNKSHGVARVYSVTWSNKDQAVHLVKKVQGPENWDTKVEERFTIPMSKSAYRKVIAQAKRAGEGQKGERRAYELFTNMRPARNPGVLTRKLKRKLLR